MKDRKVAKGLILLSLAVFCMPGARPVFAAPVLHMPTDIDQNAPKDENSLPSENQSVYLSLFISSFFGWPTGSFGPKWIVVAFNFPSPVFL